MSYTDLSHIVELTCGCHPVFKGESPPVKGDTMICIRHGVVEVVGAPDEYRAQCSTCSFGRKTGRAKHEAIMRGIKHARRTSHIVRIYDGKELVQTVGTGEKQLPVNFDGPPPY